MLPHRRKGLLLTLGGVLVLTPDSLLVRLVVADPWTIAVWRGLLMGTAMLAWLHVRYRGRVGKRLRATGRAGLVGAAGIAASNLCFVQSLTHTAVANTLAILAAAPLLTALLTRAVLAEPVERRTWVAVVAVVGGLASIVSGSIGEGLAGNLAGDLWAFGSAFGMAVYLVAARAAPKVDLVPAVAAGTLFGAIVALAVAPTVAVPWPSLPWLLLAGGVVLPLAFALITAGPRYLPAPEVGLLMLVEAMLGPLWVWLALGEVPARETVLGGAAILITLAGHELAGRNGARNGRRAGAAGASR